MIRRALRGLSIAGLMVAMALAARPSIRINLTPSMPIGVWFVQRGYIPLDRGQAVIVCLPPEPAGFALQRKYIGHGECPGDYEPLLKTVVAAVGDKVTVSDAGVAVNGQLIEHSRALAVDSAGRPLSSQPPGTYDVKDGTAWVITTRSDKSYDSRYYGPLPATSFVAAAWPLLIF